VSPPTPSSTVGHRRPTPTPSRSTTAVGGCRCCAPGTTRARGHVAVIARLRSLVELGRVAGVPSAIAAAGGTTGEASGRPISCRCAVPTPPPGQHSRRRPSPSKTLKNIMEAPSYSKWMARAPSARQTRATSPHPRVMKILPGETTSTSATVAKVIHSACGNHSSSGPLGGISSAKNCESLIHVRGGTAVHTTNSHKEPSA